MERQTWNMIYERYPRNIIKYLGSTKGKSPIIWKWQKKKRKKSFKTWATLSSC